MLTLFERRALQLLQEKQGQTVPRSDLLATIYSDCTPPKSNSLEVLIGRARRKSGLVVKAVRGVGYKLEQVNGTQA